MRTLDKFEASIHPKVSSKYSGQVMDYNDVGGNEGQQQQRAYLPPQESRQPQHRLVPPYPQQPPPPPPQQQPLYPPPPPQGAAVYSRNIYQQPDIGMAAAPPQVMEHEYLSQQQPPPHQAQHAPQYLHHRPPYGGPAVAAAAAGYPPAVARHQYAQQQPPQAMAYQQQLAMQQHYVASQPMYGLDQPPHLPPQQALQQPFLQPRVGRLPADRPLIKLSVSLIDTYKHINTVYYEERDARRAARVKEKAKKGQGTNNNGWDDENYDYIVTAGELFYGRYRIKERIGKGSFGQVVRAEDTQDHKDVAIKIIKSKKPFLMQAKTEIELLTHLNEKDPDDQHNIVRLVTHFMYRNHQCLVFEMLSLNLYELLKNTQFGGVSLNLIRKFAKQVLKSLSFLARKDVDIIHCDLKPENILLRHPKKSGIKVIDFGSSCRSNKRMYSYIQSRFYRSPEVMLGLQYSVSIDMWSLGCILAEMHTGEPLFSGSDQFDQMQKIVKLLGMVPNHMVEQANDQHRLQFFEKVRSSGSTREEWTIKQQNPTASSSSRTSDAKQQVVVPSRDPIASLTEVIRAETNRKKKHPPSETGNSPRNYEMFVDLIHKMLAYDPKQRIKPDDALGHPFITEQFSPSR